MSNSKKRVMSPKVRFRLFFIISVAVILLTALAIEFVLEYFIIKAGDITGSPVKETGLFWMIMFTAISCVIGLILTAIISKFILKPVNTLIDGMNRLSSGDYSARIKLGKYSSIKEMEDSFNALAVELQNTEILRSDFVNNFSHELKTPMASIGGLIDLLKTENLPAKKKKEYLAVIEEEIDRLASMTTNILSLSKIEKQEILTGKKKFNLSEQIRICVLLLEKNWSKRSLTPVLDFEDYYITANEDMLKQVWYNLLENAIKFSDCEKELTLRVSQDKNITTVSVENYGPPVLEEEVESIFHKFQRGSASQGRDGNGIGLSIVKHIVSLHSGKIFVKSQDGKTTFTVTLPNL